MRLAIRNLAEGAADTKAFEGSMAGYCRLSVRGYRLIYKERAERGVRVVDCIFAERRALVYEIFARLLADQATG